MFKKYYALTKPGIIYGNLLSAVAGFLLASPHHIDLLLLLTTMAGISLIIACGCVINNYTDREIDKKMARTRKRALVLKTIPVRNALTFAVFLGAAGFLLLGLRVSMLVAIIGLVGLVDYVVLYGYSKRHSVHSTLIGAASGAMPILAGYTAARGHLDSGAWLVFLIMCIWQMPHFFGIALYRLKDYSAAGIPVLPAVRGAYRTKIQIMLYIVAFTIACSLLTILNYTGYIFLIGMVVLGVLWLRKGFSGFTSQEDSMWGRKMFLFSLVVMTSLSVLLSIGARLP